MKTDPAVIYLKDYQPHAFRITESNLVFKLDWQNTTLQASHQVRRQSDSAGGLVLDLEDIHIYRVAIDGRVLAVDEYTISETSLTINSVPDSFTLEIDNSLDPSSNTRLSGLYRSGDMLCTQCEAEGFRRITPSIDRPDNQAIYTVTLSGDKQQFPVLLCNGNLVSKSNEGGQFTAIWHDPFPKPTYLFAVVAGHLSVMRDTFTTSGGKMVQLNFYARDRDIEKCEHAVGALKRSMKWDEDVYGREYDLELYNVVAVSDFNMGAMENKSLNVFNTKFVLVDKQTATDKDFENVERVIAHEYFHNWSGNRVTCRDWFQLSLKEGFTVFRDQEFGADIGSRGVCRIDDVNLLRNHQFAEDAEPMAHPIRPDSYKEINNFYTATVYEKGAEVVRMIRTLVGDQNFRKGTDLYFDRHDGEAATCDDFVAAISDASDVDLQQFKRWYSQAGTPVVKAEREYDANSKRFSLHLSQSNPDTPGQTDKQPLVIPIAIALFDHDGGKLSLSGDETEQILVLSEKKQSFHFDNIRSNPIPSLLRRFTSPVRLANDLTTKELAVLFQHDDDPFNRWEAGQTLFLQSVLENIERLKKDQPARFDNQLIALFGRLLRNITDKRENHTDLALMAKLITLPGESWIGEQSKPKSPGVIAEARKVLKQKLALSHHDRLLELYRSLAEKNDGAINAKAVSIRAMRDACLDYVASIDMHTEHKLASRQLKEAKGMSDRISALTAIADSSSPERDSLLAEFLSTWREEDLVVDKWFHIQATSLRANALDDVISLTSHEAFSHKNPNKVYSLIMAFTKGNPSGFHRPDGRGYTFLRQWVETLNDVNPQVAARLVSGFNSWRDMSPELGSLMHEELKQLVKLPNLSPDVSEIAHRALDSNSNQVSYSESGISDKSYCSPGQPLIKT